MWYGATLTKVLLTEPSPGGHVVIGSRMVEHNTGHPDASGVVSGGQVLMADHSGELEWIVPQSNSFLRRLRNDSRIQAVSVDENFRVQPRDSTETYIDNIAKGLVPVYEDYGDETDPPGMYRRITGWTYQKRPWYLRWEAWNILHIILLVVCLAEVAGAAYLVGTAGLLCGIAVYLLVLIITAFFALGTDIPDDAADWIEKTQGWLASREHTPTIPDDGVRLVRVDEPVQVGSSVLQPVRRVR